VAQAVAGYLGAVGLKATVKPYEENVFLNDIMPNGKTGEMYQMRWGGWTFDFDNTAYLMYHTGEHWNPYNKDTTLDQLLEEQRNTYDQQKRQDILQKVARYVAERALDMPIYNLNTIYGVNKRVHNFEPPADNRFRLNNVTVD
jgi:peptide/nickel transport system substrate-binding protein